MNDEVGKGWYGCLDAKGQLNSEWIYEVIISPKIHTKNYRDFFPTTVKDNPQLSDLKGPGTSKLDWRYFEHNKVDMNELQVRKNFI